MKKKKINLLMSKGLIIPRDYGFFLDENFLVKKIFLQILLLWMKCYVKDPYEKKKKKYRRRKI